MKKLTGNEIRKMWCEFWKSKGHTIIESASLIPNDDPTVLWINAGVTPLKKYFDGSVVPENKRLASIQKCIRTNDIENVGLTARHQTFFEMLGNFSIGDYFKKEAITWAFEFLTSDKWLDISLDKLYMTIYSEDRTAYNTWRGLGVEKEHIILLESNFWEIGPGPSGPDSEIFFDRGEEYDPNHIGLDLLRKEIENDRYVEIWNNVFSQFNATPGLDRRNYPELPHKNIDTGMGLERMASILQEVPSNFDTDLFMPIIDKVSSICGKKYEGQAEFKIIADHIRTITFALSDGANFGNTGRDYILRRLLRRAIRYGKKLGIERMFASDLVPVIAEVMQEAYPYINENVNMVIQKINTEEELFNRTLVNGEKRLQELFLSDTKKISGEDAFKLYDTFGFPFELTEEYAHEKGFTVSKEEFDAYMQEQKELARNSRENYSSMNVQNEELLNFSNENVFVGYDKLEVETTILSLYDGEKFVDSITDTGFVVLKETPLYVESGGQVSDKGIIIDNDLHLEVIGGFKGPNKQLFHQVKFSGTINVGDKVLASVDKTFRQNVSKNHSATHLLQKALQEVLSNNVHQAGSKVDDKRLRFDFKYDGTINDDQIIEVENLVNEKIKTDVLTVIKDMDIEEAKKMGAMALFSEKYGKIVRVVNIVDSVELCGGTHVVKSSDIGSFAIISVESKGQNVYRIEATTDSNIIPELFEQIKPYNEDMMKLLNKAANIVENASLEDIVLDFNVQINNDKPKNYKDILFNLNELNTVKKAVSELEKEYKNQKAKKMLEHLDDFLKYQKTINNINTIIIKTENCDVPTLKNMIDTLENKINGFVFVANVNDSSVNYLAKSSKELSSKIDCGKIIKEVSIESNGNGGGSKTFATGGGSKLDVVDEILIEVENNISNL